MVLLVPMVLVLMVLELAALVAVAVVAAAAIVGVRVMIMPVMFKTEMLTIIDVLCAKLNAVCLVFSFSAYLPSILHMPTPLCQWQTFAEQASALQQQAPCASHP